MTLFCAHARTRCRGSVAIAWRVVIPKSRFRFAAGVVAFLLKRTSEIARVLEMLLHVKVTRWATFNRSTALLRASSPVWRQRIKTINQSILCLHALARPHGIFPKIKHRLVVHGFMNSYHAHASSSARGSKIEARLTDELHYIHFTLDLLKKRKNSNWNSAIHSHF